jgi:hypothetical protein
LGSVVFFLLVAGAIVSWILAGIRAHKLGSSAGVGYFLMHLLSSIAVVFVLWLLIVYPVLDCRGFLCGLGETIMWVLSSVLILLIWPLILLIVLKRKYANEPQPLKTNDELLDDDI